MGTCGAGQNTPRSPFQTARAPEEGPPGLLHFGARRPFSVPLGRARAWRGRRPVLTWHGDASSKVISFGAIIGWLADRIAPGGYDDGTAEALAGGIGGGFLGRAIFTLIADRGIGSIDVVSLLTAFIGAAAALFVIWKVGHAARGGPDQAPATRS